jgi:putative transposase
MMIKAFKYRIYPTANQAQELNWALTRCRELYNAALEERIGAYRAAKKSITCFDQQKSLPDVKEGRPEYKDLHSQVLQDVLKRLDKAFQAFFRRVKRGDGKAGFPRFQGRNRFDSFTFPQAANTGIKLLSDGRVRVHGIGGSLKVKWHRPMSGKLKTCTLKREGEHWYIVFACEVEAVKLPLTGDVVGVDVGLNHFAVTSDGEFVDNPRLHRKAQAKLRVQQRRVSRRKRGSNRRRKAVQALAKTHRKVKNQRKDFHHKTAHDLVERFDLIAIEDLNVKGLARTRLAKSVSDVGWSSFANILFGKAEYAGRTVVKVSPNYTSQDCSSCGHREKHALSVREFVCTKCGVWHQRDHNAAKNILARALPSSANATVGNVCVA